MGCVQPVLFHCWVFIDVWFELLLYICPSPALREQLCSVKSSITNTIRGSPESLHPRRVRGRAGVGWGAVGSSTAGFWRILF